MGDARRGEADGAGRQRVGQLGSHQGQVVFCGLLGEGPLAHGPGPQGGVAQVGGQVDGRGQGIDHVEVLTEGLEPPFDAGRQDGRVHIFGSLQVAHHQGSLGGIDGSESEAAVTHDRRGHAVPARTGPGGVPEDLCVEVGVPVDETRSDDLALGVDLPGSAVGAQWPDGSDGAADHPDIGPIRPEPRPVHHGAAPDHQVIGGHALAAPSMTRVVPLTVAASSEAR